MSIFIIHLIINSLSFYACQKQVSYPNFMSGYDKRSKMATNKHASIRYRTLDKCFSNTGRRFFLEDLINACTEALIEVSGQDSGVKRSQIFKDINFMKSEAGWSIELLEKTLDGRKKYYRYQDPSFSIRGKGVNQGELEQISETLAILSRFRGLPHFEWIDEIRVRLEETFSVRREARETVFFEENPYLQGMDSFSHIFQAIVNRQSLIVEYKGVREEKEQSFDFHPWLLKQYNNRWFLFGRNPAFGGVTNLPLDRIRSVTPGKLSYEENEKIDFSEYFDDVIGVSVRAEAEIREIRLRVSSDLLPYIQSKPLHGSQRKVGEIEDGGAVISLKLQENYELESLLFSYMDKLEVLSPPSLRDRIRGRAERLFLLYN